MATGITKTSDVSNVIPTILAPAREQMEKPTFIEKTVTHLTLKDGDGSTINKPKFNQVLSAQTLQEGEPINNPQKLVAAAQQFVVYEVGLNIVITKKAERETPEALRARAGRFAGNAMKRKREQDIIGLFAGFSRGFGMAAQTFNPTWMAAAYSRLTTASESGQDEIAPKPYYAQIHPFHYYAMLPTTATLGSNLAYSPGYTPIDGITEEVVREYQIKELYNLPMGLNPNIPIDASGDAVSAVYSKEALVYITTSDMMEAEWDYDIHLRAHDLVMTSTYGVGEMEDEWGFKIIADATVPGS